MLGLTVAITSLLFLCFIVPVFTLKVEKVLYSNVAHLIAHEIERKHEISVRGGPTVFAQEAILPAPDPAYPKRQCVQLIGPLIVNYPHKSPGDVPAPTEFLTASHATLFITQDREDADLTLRATLVNGMHFPRQFTTRSRDHISGGVGQTTFGPISIGSLIKEDTKFMEIGRLKELLAHPERTQRVGKTLAVFTTYEQQLRFANAVAEALNGAGGSYTFKTDEGDFTLKRGAAPAEVREGEVVIPPAAGQRVSLAYRSSTATAPSLRLSIHPNNDSGYLGLTAALDSAEVRQGEDVAPHKLYTLEFAVRMPPAIADLAQTRTPDYYLASSICPPFDPDQTDPRHTLKRDLVIVANRLQSEMHSRASFSISCLILVIVGCALGMMFKSGNFLSAFALSVIPALMCITLVVAGQQTADNIPNDISKGFKDPLGLALGLIWSGNLIALVLAAGLMAKLQRR